MRKILLLTIVILVSCSKEDQIEPINVSLEQGSFSKLEGNLLSFKDSDSFIKEYSLLSEFKTANELKNWISKKGHSSALDNPEAVLESDDMIADTDSIIYNTGVVYSDALKAIVNSESKFKVNGKVIWLDKSFLYVLTEKDYDKMSEQLKDIKNNLEVYGSVFNITNPKDIENIKERNNYKEFIPNQNRSITYIYNELNRKRCFLDLFNETIVINNQLVSSKMYLRSTIKYRSCSTWRCTWKSDNSTIRRMRSEIAFYSDRAWSVNQNFYNRNTENFQGSYTVLLATYVGSGVILSQKFSIAANIETTFFLNNTSYSWKQEISWFF